MNRRLASMVVLLVTAGLSAVPGVGRAILPASPINSGPAPGDYDGDGKTDIALKGSNGFWYIDLAANGFGGRWDLAHPGYGDDTAVPTAADYDDDGRTDLSVKGADGSWGIDYASAASGNFGYWNLLLFGYGNAASVPVPADYDFDGKADLSVKSDAGVWYINYSADGLGSGWNAQIAGYGNAAAIPVPADYNGDGHADLAVKDAGGCWYIDYWAGGYAGWNEIRCGYGNATAVPIPADYDNDGRADLSIKDNGGNWYIDFAAGGFGAWNAIYSGYGNNSTIGVPADYDGDGLCDLAVYGTTNGFWYIDYASDGFNGWNTWVDNPGRVLFDWTRPYVTSTTIYGEGGVPASVLTVGLRYTVDVVVHRGNGTENGGGLEINDLLGTPSSLKLTNPIGTTYVGDISQGNTVTETHRRFALTCTEPGNFPLGFQWRTAPPYYSGGEVINREYEMRVVVASPPQTAVSGQVRRRVRNASGIFVPGTPIEGASVTMNGVTTLTDGQGRWHLPIAGPGKTVRITAPGRTEVNVVNLDVPVSGVFVNVEMEQAFTSLPQGISYKTYIDYSRGRTLFHVTEINPARATVRIGRSTFTPGVCHPACQGFPPCPNYDLLHDVGEALGASVMMNGTWWNICNGNPLGYVYANGFLDSEVWCDNRGGSTTDCSGSNLYYIEGEGTTPLYPAGTSPLFAIAREGPGQGFDIVASHSNFLESPSNEWSQVGNPAYPIWDVAPRDGISDLSYGLQIPNPPLLRDGKVIAGGSFVYDSYGNYDYAFARTSVGIGHGMLYLVVADGENLHGANGATGNQLARFYRDVLGATRAMGLDSGLSSEMQLRTPGGLYQVNSVTGEDATIQVNPYTEVLPQGAGAIGSVAYYIAVLPAAPIVSAPETQATAFSLRVRSTPESSRYEFDLTLPQAGAVDLRLFDVGGRQVAIVHRGELAAGSRTLTWNGHDDRGGSVGAGVYFYRLRAGQNRADGSVVVLR